MGSSQTLFKTRHKDKVKKIPCTINNQMGSCLIKKSTISLHEIGFLKQILVIWSFGIFAFFVAMFFSSISLIVVLCAIAGILGYMYLYSRVIGKQIKVFNIDDIKSVTCTRVEVCLFFKDTTVFNMKMSPNSQFRILTELEDVLTNEYKRKVDLTDQSLIVQI